MFKLEYSQIVRKKLKKLRSELTKTYGENTSKKYMSKISKEIRRLEAFPQSGTNISSQYGIDGDYMYIFIAHNYFFYRIKDKDTIDYWDE